MNATTTEAAGRAPSPLNGVRGGNSRGRPRAENRFQEAEIAQSLPTSAPASSQSRAASRSALARARVSIARAALADCHLCEHHCGVNRLADERGLCHAGAEARVFSAQVEVSDELELIPVFAIAFSGCDLRCDFCITGAESWNPRAGHLFHEAKTSRQRLGVRQSSAAFGRVNSTEKRQRTAALQNLAAPDTLNIAASAKVALADGARSIMILGGEPTVHLPSALELVAALPDDARLIWKTNAHGSAQARALLDGLFDVWLADYKFGNDACALRLSRTSDYTRIVRENLCWAARHSELIVRHLLMPGHVECCWKLVAEWLAVELPGVKVNLRSGFWPAWQAARHPELRGTTSASEANRALALARELNLNLIQ